MDRDKKNEHIITTKIKIIISEHNLEDNEERIVFNEIIKLKDEENVTSKQIITALGSVRGVKNKVKERIEQFLATKEGNFPTKENRNDTLGRRNTNENFSNDILSLNYESLESNKKNHYLHNKFRDCTPNKS